MQPEQEKYKYEYNGEEFQGELGLDEYAFGWRNYDPALARFNKIDRFAEKYYAINPYHYTADNPVFFREIAGDSLTENAWVWANKILTKANNEIESNNKKIAGLNKDFENGKISKKKYRRKLKRLNKANSEYSAAINEIDELASSSQWYDVALTDGFSDDFEDGTRGITSFDFNTNMVVMTFSNEKPDLGIVAHEFKHAYQFEIGDISFVPDGYSSRFLLDIFDEKEANIRSGFFGTKTFSSGSGSIRKIKISNEKIVIDYYQMFKKDNKKRVFRYGGKTYKSN